MTISYPRMFPNFGVGPMRFVLQRTEAITPERSGRLASVAMGWPVWRLEADFPAITDETAVQIEAWIASLRGMSEGFIGHDVRRWYPASYPGGTLPLTRYGGAAFDGSASSFSLDGTRSIVTLNGLPSSLAISAGDFIGFKGGAGFTKRACVKVIEGGTAVNGVLAITVEPAVRAIVSTWASVTAHLDKPGCNMKLLPDTQIGDNDPSGQMTARIVAQQYFPD